MGLDMYLSARLFIGGEYEHRHVKGGCRFSMGEGERKVEYEIPMNEISSIEKKVGYWRKANAIHKWFVDFVQNGRDDCQPSWVSREHLEVLKQRCINVLGDHSFAADVLPTESGFFFGSTEYDEWYFQDLEDTVEILNKALAMPDEYDFYYQASW